MKFRTDINGLRALAVIAVVLFHFNPSWVPGGFAGVDVFFVISGFLMTGLIFRGLENNNFSIINFYIARANRIIPALSVVCLALLVFGWFYLTPLDYQALGKHVASSMGFVSNIIYWQESGYFDAASHSKWLLHTWSLSVEWQFYMIYPLVLVLLKKCMSLTNIKRLLVVGTVVGFVFSIYATYRWPNPAYFLFPTRAWEMMMGGLAFLYPLQNIKETSKKYLEWAGIVLILASYAFISKNNLWPGYLALIPVLGAYLVILANCSGSVITDNIVMQKVGLWSYSIYLWHWPVVVFGYYFEMQHREWIGIPISVVLGFCSYKFVESIKFPALASISFKPIATLKPLWMLVIIGLISYFVFVERGVLDRFNTNNVALYKKISKEIVMPHRRNGYCFYSFKDDQSLKINKDSGKDCYLGSSKRSTDILLFGDSFAGHSDPFWAQYAEDENVNIQSVSTNWCYPSFSKNFTGPKTHPAYSQCLLNRKFLKESIEKQKYNTLILGGSWNGILKTGYIDEVLDVVSYANKHGIKVIVMPTPPSYFKDPYNEFEKTILMDVELDITRLRNNDDGNSYISDKLKKMKDDIFINQESLFNENGLFEYYNIHVPYSLDGSHMSLLGSKKAYEHFLKSNDSYKIRKYTNVQSDLSSLH